ncbi:hypothetical protein FHR22_003211 [Sphingopyxis panaciterrae]|uniref:hypothetical protein n=1 Tax=Sphingopyxis panaciterrae TaxID=363841 RepID=UPI00142271B7|nr:hypothetical protein [Sphingopyxis panaciterrae]NIJ38500.1 hypothetical protein [Sphingopyxis panaciterrae]
MRKSMIFAFGAPLALVACGGPQGDDKNEKPAAMTSGRDAGWDATDACKLLDKAVLGAVLGDAVTETSLAFVHQPTPVEAATSECTYRLKGGGTATLMARRSPIADNTPEAIAQARKTTESTMRAFSDKSVEDVPHLGKAAFFVPGINQMNVFLDDQRFLILTLGTAPDDRVRDIAADLVRMAAG